MWERITCDNSGMIGKLLSQNSKMKASGKNIFNFTIPAFRTPDGQVTCPNATTCISGCYARQGAYNWKPVKAKHMANFNATKHEFFVGMIIREIESKRVKPTHIRIHDSGDFYSMEYLQNWIKIAGYLPKIQFYAYTKMISMVKSSELPPNFKIIFSLGGREDTLINQNIDRHSRVFETLDDLIQAGYVDASDNDLIALGDNPKIGLVYHGAKSFNNTTWRK